MSGSNDVLRRAPLVDWTAMQSRYGGIIPNQSLSQIHANLIVQYAAWAPLTAFTASLLIGWWLVHSGLSKFALDHPNERSLHQTPIPRTGGIAIHAGIVLAWATASPNISPMLWLVWGILVAVSFYDDVRGVPVVVRLVVHLLVAGALAASLVPQDTGIVGVLIATLAIAWMANIYNFMDGSDGLAGGMTALGFSFYCIAAWLAGNTELAVLSLSVATAAAAFLVFNLHPARIFMGDVGSIPLGFLAGALGFAGWVQQDWPWWFPLLVFSPFIVDASATLARRLLTRERIWKAHSDHYYQRLVRMGWGHRKTAWAEYLLMTVCGVIAVMSLGRTPAFQATMLAAVVFVYGVLATVIGRAWSRNRCSAAR
jgi:UDP-GlcNAc:undecaprenyl-phosphate/decaprenyl-phosphate GlcNAc-1-phosphate transferase